ncbi:MAG: monoamine oxidase, partial [Myxococcota bacterium]
ARAAGGVRPLIEIKDGAQQDRLVGGAQQLCQRLAEGLDVRLSEPVRHIDQSANKVVVSTDAGEHIADRVIVAIPPALAGRIRYTPDLPPGRDQLCQRMPMGATTKFIAIYDRPFWREAGLSGEVVADGKPFTVVFDNTTPEGTAALLGFIVGAPARRFTTLPPHQQRAEALGAFARWFGPHASTPQEIAVKDWSEDPWTRGCPIGVCGPLTLSIHGDALTRPIDRIYWAGTETAEVWTGFMEGAVRSGERAASEVLRSDPS